MEFNYDDPKAIDKRVALENKKLKDLHTALTKVRQSLEDDRKAYCFEFKKLLKTYATSSVHTPLFSKMVDDGCEQLDALDRAYLGALDHIDKVPCAQLDKLQKKQAAFSGKAVKADLTKAKDFEYDRLESTKLSLLHFINAQMFLHAKAVEVFSSVYEDLATLKFEQEFPQADRTQLKQILEKSGIRK